MVLKREQSKKQGDLHNQTVHPKNGVDRQSHRLLLDVHTITIHDAMNVNNSNPFETLLKQYESFLNMWQECSP